MRDSRGNEVLIALPARTGLPSDRELYLAVHHHAPLRTVRVFRNGRFFYVHCAVTLLRL